MTRAKTLTIADVARHAGVSIATASRVINKSHHPVKETTRERVWKAVKELHFTPSAVAQALATRRTRMVGVIVGDSNDPYFSAIVRGVEDVGREKGYLVVVCNSDRIPEVELAYVKTLLNHQVAGLIFAGGGLTDLHYVHEMKSMSARIFKNGGAIVALSEHLFPAFQVTIDNRAAVRDLAAYLIRQGHRRIALLTGPEGLNTTRLRTEGYRQALEAHGIDWNPGWVIKGRFRFQGGVHAVEQLFENGALPTAILASNDEMAIGAMVSLKQRGLRIPEDISLVGVDDIPASEYVDPPLTTVKVPLEEMGASGMRRLLRLLDGEKLEQVLWLPHEIIERKSAAPPRESLESRTLHPESTLARS